MPTIATKVDGHDLQAPGRAELNKRKNGVWEYTTAKPLTSELYTYTFFVDGLQITDPNNIAQVRDVASVSNYFIVDCGDAQRK